MTFRIPPISIWGIKMYRFYCACHIQRQSATGPCQYIQWLMDSWVIDSRNSQFIIIIPFRIGTLMEEIPPIDLQKRSQVHSTLRPHDRVNQHLFDGCNYTFPNCRRHISGEHSLLQVHIQNIPSHSTPLLILG